MEVVRLRRAGGSLVLTIPKAIVKSMQLAEGAEIGLSLADGKLVGEPTAPPAPCYTLDKLLAACEPSDEFTKDDQDWLDGPAIGNEIL